MQQTQCPVARCIAGLEAANGYAEGAFNFERDIDSFIPVEVTETRLTGEQLSSIQLHVLHATPLRKQQPLLLP